MAPTWRAAAHGLLPAVQGVFQDPFSSYNPIFKADHVFGMIRGVYFSRPGRRGVGDAGGVRARGRRPRPRSGPHKYPHQLSGGQLQRLLIARALLLDIRLLVADEIISMLDASTRIDVLNLLGDLKERGLGILFITHDLSLGYYSSQRTVILSRGAIVEMGVTEKVYGNPLHPYTRSLIASVPHLHKSWSEVAREVGRDATGTGPCSYHQAYPDQKPGTADARPALAEVETDHFVGCAKPNADGSCGTDLASIG